ncbi:hypothetical protein ASPZODRAFT_69557 [Penicilliopsis zonata CBS 506.65]|uniref:Major facilitator superfamily (MFS) profile domain-containing protein n=1 Tax=Penicilliopsis zonata CBS 506.65 TaxID=1073090 RepID=A0A1L9SDI7_9EURO|nr:hypothetical protein ASPZODRAFT_69557 [Penicilliopsis zonata CBS 506.65]OJJ45280.1 hypothetical protein ASPZODRAFT_69557 [Penicilliopsis zonata CBS 506.65]
MRSLYVWLLFAVLTSATNGYDGSMMNGLQALTQWKDSFNNPGASERGLLNAIMSVGGIVSLPLVPYIADYAGRRAGILTGCVLMIIGVVLQTVGYNIHMFIAARFLIGFGVSIAQGSAPLLIAELVHPQHRAVFTTVYNATWYLGSVIAAWVTFGTFNIGNSWAWRIPSLFQGIPSVIQLMAIWMVPESPRFLIAKGKHEEARKVLANAHARGDETAELIDVEFREIQQTIKLEQEFESNGWQELFRTPGNRHRLFILISLGFFSQWSGNGLVSYYMTDVLDGIGVTNTDLQLEINGILNIVNMVVATAACFFIDQFGRRPLFLFATGGMMVSFICWTICAAEFVKTGFSAAANAEIAFIFIYYCCYDCAWTGLLVGYSVEILPYRIRAKGMVMMFLSVDAALFFNTYVNPIALNHLDWKYYIVYDVWLFVELLVVYFCYVETRNTPLEEIVRFFDGDGALLGGDLATTKSRQLADTVEVAPVKTEEKASAVVVGV